MLRFCGSDFEVAGFWDFEIISSSGLGVVAAKEIQIMPIIMAQGKRCCV